MCEDWASHAADEFRCRPGLSFGGPYHTRDGGTVESVGKGYEVVYPAIVGAWSCHSEHEFRCNRPVRFRACDCGGLPRQ